MNRNKGKLIVLTGPSGVGKGTLLQSLLDRHPELYFSISVTTRLPRMGEIEGKNYYFVDQPRFQQMIANHELLEWAEYAGNYYGTPRKPVEERISQGCWVILEIEVAGARQIAQTFPEALRIFILPPSVEILEQRIRNRALDAEAAIEKRLLHAEKEIIAAQEFDVQIVNDDFAETLEKIEAQIFAPVMMVGT
ncbi:MAG: guanylate kinase [Coleofasciculaceae cyanobacterium SM2_1_6]|nr:guanylate kinase [Coleofasciculaceae cyanobacterium SM2_1_6]